MKQGLFVGLCLTLVLGASGCVVQVQTTKKTAGTAPYSISGRVQNGVSGGLSGVQFQFQGTGAPPSSAMSDGSGNFTQGRFPTGTFIVTPTPTAQYQFLPASQTIPVTGAVSGVDFDAIPIGASITLLSPNGGEAFATGTSLNINWTTTATGQLGANIILQYSTDAGATWNLIVQSPAVTVSDGTYTWQIPNTLVNEDHVRVRAYIANYPVLASNSAGNFTISQAYKVSGAIKKGTGGGLAGVRVDFSNGAPSVVTDGSGNYTATGFLPGSFTVTPNSSSYIFTPVSQTATITNADVALPDFTATPSGASLTVTAPATAASLLPGNPASVVFTAANLAGTNAKVEYSPDNGTTWQTVSASISLVDGANTVVWTTPTTATTTGLIRVSSLDYPLAVAPAVSGQFTILSLYNLSGSITAGGLPLSGVSLTFSGTNAPPPVTTDGTGAYTSGNFIAGSYTVIPSLAGYIFTPPSQSVSITNADATNVNFTAQLASVALTLITPADAAELIPGTSYNMIFSTTALAGSTVKIEYSADSGATWSTLNAADPIATDGSNSYLWTVSSTPTAHGRIRITSNAFPSVVAQNNADFTIKQVYNMSGQVLSGGVGLGGVTINFLGTDAPAPVTTAADGSWTQAKFRDGTFTVSPSLPGYLFNPASSSVTVVAADVTGVNFAAQPVAASVTLVAPANAAIVMPNQNVNIVFATSLLAGTSVSIDYSVDGGTTWTNLTNSFVVTTDGSQIYAGWVTPVAPSINAMVRVKSNAFPAVSDQNSAPFTIAQVYMVKGAINTGTGPLSGVTLAFSGPDAPGNATDDGAGAYTQANFRNGTFTVTPFLSGYVFTPASSTITVSGGDVLNVNFFGQAVATGVTLVAPADGSDLLPSQATNILFSTTALTGTAVKIEYASDGVTFSTVTGGASVNIVADGSQSFGWTNDGTVTSQGRIRITSLGYPGIQAQNAGTFNVVKTFNLSGSVTMPTGPLAGVNLSFSGPVAPAGVTTDGTGAYTQAAFRDGTFTVVPTLSGYIFTPPTQTVTITTADATAVNFVAQPVAASLNLASPANGAQLMPSTATDIDFNANALDTTTATIEYSADGGTTWTTLINNFAIVGNGTQTYSGWTTPATATTTGEIRITSNAYASIVTVNSADFQILSVHNLAGTIQTGTAANPLLPLAGVTVSFTGPNAPGSTTSDATGAYSQAAFRDGTFTVSPSLAGYIFTPTTASITVSGSDISNANFYAQPAAALIALIAPADAADLMPNQATSVTFSTNQLAGTSVKIEYSSDGGTTWSTLAAAQTITTDGTFTYSWTTPATATNTGKIRITSNEYATISAVNGATFNILNTYGMSGKVTTGTGNLSGVTLTFSGPNAPAAAVTNGTGDWSQSAFRDGTFTVTPSATGYIFSPAVSSQTVSGGPIANVNFFATPVAGAATLVSPQDGDILMPSVPVNIVFSTSALAGTTLTISYSNDSGVTYTPLTSAYVVSADGTQTYSGWTTPATATTMGKIRIASNAYPTISDENTAPFTIATIYNVSGTITTPTGALNGVALSFSGPDAPINATTAGAGAYTQGAFRDGTFTVTPFLTGYLFTPTSQTVTVAGADLTGVNFTAQPAAAGVTLIAPADGAQIMPSISNPILFSTTALAGTTVKIEYASDGVTFSTVAGGSAVAIATDGSQSFAWTSPATATTTAKIRITALAFAGISAVNANPFTVLNTYSVSGNTATATGALSGVSLSFSGPNAPVAVTSDVSGNFTQAAFRSGNFTVTPSLAGYIFTPPSQSVTVSNSALSGVNFSAQPTAASLSLSTPANGAQLMPNTATPIVFTANALTGTTVKIEWSTDSGATWSTLAATFAISGNGTLTYNGWTTPATATNNGRLRITSNSYATIATQNTADLQILSTYSMSGTIMTGTLANPLAALPGVTLTFSGPNAPGTVTTDAGGAFSQSPFRNGSFTVQPTLTGYIFTPASSAVTVSGSNLTGVNFYAQPATASLVLVSPADGAQLMPGQATTITFSANQLINTKATIEYSADGGSTWSNLTSTFVISANGTANFAWTPPVTATTNGKIRITSNIYSGVTASNVNPFTILTTYSLSGQTTTGSGNLSGVTLTFSGPNAPATATSDVSGNWTQSAFRSGTFTVTPSKTGYIFSPSNSSQTVSAGNLSGVNFFGRPVDASLNLLTPVDGGDLMPNTSNPITFVTSSLAGTTVLVEYSADNGTTWSTLSAAFSIATDGTQSLPWTTPVTATTLGLVRLTSNSYATIKDVNATPFHILTTYTVSGNVVDGTGTGSAVLAGVSLTFSGPNAPANATTDVSGNYTQSAFRNGTFTVTPSKTGYVFSPSNRSVTVTTANLTGVNFTASPSDLALALISPTGGQNLLPNTAYAIQFSTTSLAGSTVRIEYSSDGGTTYVPVVSSLSIATDGLQSYSWTVPATPTAQGMIRISSLKYPATVSVNATAFNVLATYSISGNIKAAGAGLANVTVSFVGTNAPAAVTTDASGNFTQSSFPNGSYTVTPSLSGYIFSPVSLNPTVAGGPVTGQDFTAQPSNATITLIAPQNTAEVMPSQATNILFNTTGLAGTNVNIDYSLDDGATWLSIVAAQAITTDGPQTYTWNVPAVNSTTAKIRVTSVPYPTTGDKNSGDFTILQTFKVTGSVTLNGAALQNVTFTFSGPNVPAAVSSDVTGAFSQTAFRNGAFTVTPSLAGYIFTPPSQSFNVTTADVALTAFVAQPSNASIALISPADGSSVVPNVSTNVIFNTAGLAGTDVKIEYSADNGGTWTTLSGTFAIASDGTHTYANTFTTATTQGLIKLTSNAFPTVTGGNAADFTVLNTYPVSGTVTVAGVGLTGVTMSFSGVNAPAAVTTGAGGAFSQSNFPNGSYTVTPSLAGYVFSPSSLPETVASGAVTGVNFTAQPAGATLTLVYPNDTAQVIPNQPLTILFSTNQLAVAPFNSTTAKVEYSSDNGTTWTTINSALSITADGSQSQSWTPTVPGANYKIRITSTQFPGVSSVNAGNFTVLNTFTLSGNVTNSGTGNPVPNVTMTFSGPNAPPSVVTDSSGNWTQSGFRDLADFSVVPAATGFIFSPASLQETVNGADVSGINFDVTPSGTAVSLITPANGSEVLAGLSTNLSFFTSGLAGTNVHIEYSSDSGSTWSDIAASVPVTADGTNNYSWTAPSTGTLHARVRVSSLSYVLSSTNSADFSVVALYNATGAVTLNSAALSGVTMTFSGPVAPGTVTSTSSGSSNWSQSGFRDGASFTVTPSDPNYNFSPASSTFSISGADAVVPTFIAQPIAASIQINSPSDGSINYPGTVTNIAFTTNALAGTQVNVQQSSNGGTSWSAVPGGTGMSIVADGAQSLAYTIPATAGSNYKIRIASVAYPGVIGGNVNAWSVSATWTLTGNVTQAGVALAGVSLQFTGSNAPAAVTSTSGAPNYSQTGFQDSQTFTVTPVLSGYTFLPANRSVTFSGANQTGVNFTAQPADAAITVLSPVAGNTFLPSESSSIQFNTSSLAGTNVKIEQSVDGGTTWTTVSASTAIATDGPQSVSWTAPGSPTTQGKIKITSLAYATITTTSFGNWSVIQTYQFSGSITSATGGLQNVVLSFSGPKAPGSVTTPAGGAWAQNGFETGQTFTITPSLAGWIFSPSQTTQPVAGANVASLNFTAQPAAAAIVLTNPFDGAQYLPNTAVTIGFTTVSLAGTSVKIEYSSNNGTSWSTITASKLISTDGAQTQAWTTPATATAQAKIRITDLGYPSVTGGNAANFTILNTYVVSGSVFSAAIGNPGIQGVSVTLTGSLYTATVTTDVNGLYSTTTAATNVPNGTYTLTPTLAGYIFTPSNQVVTVSSGALVAPSFSAQPAGASLGIGSPGDGADLLPNDSSDDIKFYAFNLSNTTVKIEIVQGATVVSTVDPSFSITTNGLYQKAWTTPATPGAYRVRITSNQFTNPVIQAENAIDLQVEAVHNITGRVLLNDDSHTPLASPTHTIQLNYYGPLSSGTVSTDSSGNYAIQTVDGTTTIDPNNTNYFFSPSSLSVTVSGANVAAPDLLAQPSGASLSLTQPTAGSQYLPGVAQNIVYNAFNLVNSDVAIELSNDDGTTWSLITTQTIAADGQQTYAWTTPATPLTTYRIRVRSTNYTSPQVLDGDASSFTVVPTYTLSGHINDKTLAGAGVSGITVYLTGPLNTETVTTDSTGKYQITDASNGSYTVTPVSAAWSFTPGTQSPTVSGANTTAGQILAQPVSASISITSPLAGNTLLGGVPCTIAFSTASLLNTGVEFEVSTDGGSTWSVLSTPTVSADGTQPTLSWTPPNSTLTNLVSIRATSVQFTSPLVRTTVSSLSVQQTFSMSGVVTNNGQPIPTGTPLTVAPAHSITFSSAAASVGSVNVSLTDGTWSQVGFPPGSYTVEPTSTTYNFVPAFRVVTVSSGAVPNVNFSYQPKGANLAFVYPTAGTVLYPANNDTLVFFSANLTGTHVKIEYTTDGGATYFPVTLVSGDPTDLAVVDGTNLLQWTVPLPAAAVVVRVTDLEYPSVVAYSDSLTVNNNTATVTGYVRTPTVHSAIAQVSLNYSTNGGNYYVNNTNTDASGKFTQTGFLPGQVTITPSKQNMNFSPSSISYTLTSGENHTFSDPTFLGTPDGSAYMTILTPGGETQYVGEQVTIRTLNSSNLIGFDAKLDVSIDNGLTWTNLRTWILTGNTDTTLWTPTSLQTTAGSPTALLKFYPVDTWSGEPTNTTVGFTVLHTYTIDGYVRRNDINGLAGVTVSFGGPNVLSSVTTDASGYYIQSGFREGGIYTITPSYTGMFFRDTQTLSNPSITVGPLASNIQGSATTNFYGAFNIDQGQLTLTHPTGNANQNLSDVWPLGFSENWSWTRGVGSTVSGTVTLQLSLDGGTSWNTVTGAPALTSYAYNNWTVASPATESFTAKGRIISNDYLLIRADSNLPFFIPHSNTISHSLKEGPVSVSGYQINLSGFALFQSQVPIPTGIYTSGNSGSFKVLDGTYTTSYYKQFYDVWDSANDETTETIPVSNNNVTLNLYADDSQWIQATNQAGAPGPRYLHALDAADAGRFFVFGGYNNGSYLSDAAMYDVPSDTWTSTTTVNEPTPRYYCGHTSLYGVYEAVWGGYSNVGYTAAGGQYTFSLNNWQAIPSGGSEPAPRYLPIFCVCGGSSAYNVLCWGGYGSGGYLSTGGVYNASANTWSALPAVGVTPSGRYYAGSAYYNGKAYIFGGYGNSGLMNDLYSFDTTNGFVQIVATNPPSPREEAQVFTYGQYLVVYGGYSSVGGWTNTGAYLNLLNIGAGWTQMSTIGAPQALELPCAAMDTNSGNLDVWSGENISTYPYASTSHGYRWTLSTNAWTEMTPLNAPAARKYSTAAYNSSGSYLMVWGGNNDAGLNYNSGGIYSKNYTHAHQLPASTTAPGAPYAPEIMANYNLFWSDTTSSYYLFIGDHDTSPYPCDFWQFNTLTGTWTQLAVPAAWNGEYIDNFYSCSYNNTFLIWGGQNSGVGIQNQGFMFNPSTNTWAAMAPAPFGPSESGACVFDAGNGQVGFLGGETSSATATATAYWFNPSSNTWSAMGSGSMVNARNHPMATLFQQTSKTITSINRTGGLVTLTTSAPHFFLPGQRVTVIGVTDNSFNSTPTQVFTVANAPTSTTLQYLQAGADASSTGGTVQLPRRLVVFGGENTLGTDTNDTAYYEIPTGTWYTVNAANAPSVRESMQNTGHGVELIYNYSTGSYDNNGWLVCGGYNNTSGLLTNLAYLDLRNESNGTFYAEDFNSTTLPPGWVINNTYGAEWTYGAGVNGYVPANGATGTNFIGTNLDGSVNSGDYPYPLSGTDFVRSASINCTNRSNVNLVFRRYAQLDYQPYLYATIDVSNNGGGSWTTVWQNNAGETYDTSWTTQTINISAYADNQPNVMIRWTLGSDIVGTYNLPGWNIDDIHLTGTNSATPWSAYALGATGTATAYTPDQRNCYLTAPTNVPTSVGDVLIWGGSGIIAGSTNILNRPYTIYLYHQTSGLGTLITSSSSYTVPFVLRRAGNIAAYKYGTSIFFYGGYNENSATLATGYFIKP
ncbi:MAG: Kelch repeat-containing protein [Planctomycetota bacterium]